MANIIAVWGSQGVGKTTIATSIACEINDIYKGEKRICVLFSDGEIPVIPYVLQNEKTSDAKSIGELLSSDEINDEKLFKTIITIDGMENIGFLGYRHGENSFSYPKLAEQNIKKLFDLMSLIFDVVIVDVMSVPMDLLSRISLNVANCVITVVGPDVKSLSWFDSQVKPRIYAEFEKKNVMVINHSDDYLIYPDNEISILYGGINHIVPFSIKVRQITLDGRTIREKGEKRFSDSICRIIHDAEGKA